MNVCKTLLFEYAFKLISQSFADEFKSRQEIIYRRVSGGLWIMAPEVLLSKKNPRWVSSQVYHSFGSFDLTF